MNNQQHPIDDLFRRGFEEHEIKPSPAVWNRVNAATKASEPFNWKLLVAAAITVTVAFGSYFSFNNSELGEAVQLPVVTEDGLVPMERVPQEGPQATSGSVTEPKVVKPNQAKPQRTIKAGMGSPTFMFEGIQFSAVNMLEGEDEPIAWIDFEMEYLNPALWQVEPSPSRRFRKSFEVKDPAQYALEVPKNNPDNSPDYTKALLNYAGSKLDNLVQAEKLEKLPFGLGSIFVPNKKEDTNNNQQQENK